MNNKKQEKDLYISDVHGCADQINKTLKDIGFETSKESIVNFGSPSEKIPKGEISDLLTVVSKVRGDIEEMQKRNDAHHDAQYKKMYPNKKK